tara:strand:- start:42 stop:1349 length:1308 start_codon:yes stop_codon:yes gene_type:complete
MQNEFDKKIGNFMKFKLLFIIFTIFLHYLKTPYLFQSGRFMMNDAVHYANALNSNWHETFFLIYWPAGYLNFFANLTSFLNSRLINIEFAALFNVYFCYLLIFLLHYIIIFYKSDFFKTNFSKLFASIIISISPIFVFEIWLDSHNAQVYLCLLSFFILFLKHDRSSKFFSPFILGIAGLSGVYSCLLTPLFIYKNLKERTKINFINSLIITLTSIIQFSIILVAKLSGKLYMGKLNFNYFLNFNEIESFTYNILIRPFLSSSLSNYFIKTFEIENNNQLKVLIIFLVILFILSLLFYILFQIKNKNLKLSFELTSLIYLFFTCSILVTVGGVNDSVGGRYSVIPSFCIIFILFKLSFIQKKLQVLKTLSFTLIFISLLTGIYDYRVKKWIIFYECINCPEWKKEIRKFNLNNNYKIKVWPYDVVNEIDLKVKYY